MFFFRYSRYIVEEAKGGEGREEEIGGGGRGEGGVILRKGDNI